MPLINDRCSQSLTTRIAAYWLSIAIALAAPLSSAQSNNQDDPVIAGRVIVVSGDVIARGADGDRPLSRREVVYVGDTIFTDARASTQIRMVDDALIALQESTEFTIAAYQYEEIGSDESTVELIRGGFRTITGKIGQQNRDAYEANIGEFATIGIRGTDFEAVITPNGVFTGVYDGGTTVFNTAGALDLGFDADFDFAQIATPNSPPTGLLLQPLGLGNIPFTATVDDNADDSSEEETEQDDDGNPDGNTNGNGGGNTNDTANADATAEPAQDTASLLPSPDVDNQSAAVRSTLNLQTPALTLSVAATAASATSAIAATGTEDLTSTISVNPSETRAAGSVSCATNSSLCVQLVDGAITGTSTPVTAPEIEIDSTEDISENPSDTVIDSGISDPETNIDEGAVDISDDIDGSDDGSGDDNGNAGGNGNGNGNAGGNGNGNGNAGGNGNGNGNAGGNGNGNGNAGGNGNSNGNAGGNGNGNGNAGGNGLINVGVSRSGNRDNNTADQALLEPQISVDTAAINWRRWNNSSDANFVLVSHDADGLIVLSTSDYLAQLNPTPVSNLTGKHSYATTFASAFVGSGSAGEVSSVRAAMNVDFDTGNIDQGNLDVVVANQVWLVQFDGAIHNGLVDLNAINGQLFDGTDLISNSIEANLGGAFTGETGDSFVGGFDLIDEINALNTTNGLYTIDR